jgi:hypothetical protein
MKYLSFSLWGNEPIYNVGAIRNSELWREIYPDWQMVVYYDDTVPIETIDVLNKNGVDTIKMNTNIFGCFWRFLISDKNDCEYAIFRDTDSRISLREKLAVDEWIESKKSIHVMRDHPYHGIPAGNDRLGILAGMWGIKGNIIPISDMVEKFIINKKNSYGIDQNFLKIVYSVFENDKFIHDEFFEKKKFPYERINGRFVGERMTELDLPFNEDYKILINK